MKTFKNFSKESVELYSTINFAVFYNKLCWHTLVQGCLLPIINNLGIIHNYVFSISFEQGDHLRISCIVDADKAIITKRYLANSIKHWLRNNPSPNRNEKEELSHLWLDFDCNSIHFNTFNCIFDLNSTYPEDLSILDATSTQLINHLVSAQPFNIEEVISKVLTLGIVTISKHLNQENLKSINNLIYIINNTSEIAAEGNLSISSIIEDYNENKDFIFDFYRSLSIHKENLPADGWQLFLHEQVLNIHDDHLYNRISYILTTVNSIFGLGQSMQIYILVFLRQFILSYLDLQCTTAL